MTLEDCYKAKENKTPVTIKNSYLFSETPTFITEVIPASFDSVRVNGGGHSYEIHRVRIYSGQHSSAGTWFTYPEHKDLLKNGEKYLVFIQQDQKKYFEKFCENKWCEYDSLISHFCKVNDPE